MSESKFLPFQDADGDGLPDVCGELPTVEPDACPSCIPNSGALVPDWRTLDRYSPFLNEKTCMYQITTSTRISSIIGGIEDSDGLTDDELDVAAEEALEEIFSGAYEDNAIESLLEAYSKDTSYASIELIREVIEHTDYDLNMRPGSRLKLLYSVPYDSLQAIDDADAGDDEEAEDEDGDVEVWYDATEMFELMMKVRKGLYLYGRHLNVYRAIESSNLLFLNDNSKFELADYGDWGLSRKSSVTARLLPQLDAFLNKKKLNLAGVGGFFGEFANRNRTIRNITFKFNSEYRLKQLTIEADGCSEEPLTITKLDELLISTSAWSDPTAAAYFAQARDMAEDLTAKEPSPWMDFLKRFTYPEVYDIANSEYDETGEISDFGMSCIGEALQSEAKQLGQDIMDEVFSLGDSIAYMFHNFLCNYSLEDQEKLREDMEIYLTETAASAETTAEFEEVMEAFEDHPAAQDLLNEHERPNPDFKRDRSKIKAVAKEQALAEIRQDEDMFANFCEWLFNYKAGAAFGPGSATQRWNSDRKIMRGYRKNQRQEHGRQKFDRLKLCGLLDLMTKALECLFGGLTLEQALGKMLESALRVMSIENFGDLFIGLPVDKQQELSDKMMEKIASGNIFPEGSEAEAASDDTAANYETPDPAEAAPKPWQQVKSKLQEGDWTTKSEGPYGGVSYSGWSEHVEENRRTLGPSVDVGAVSGQLSNSIIMEAYIQALLEVYLGDELSLMDLLGKFPGAPIIGYIFATLTCPQQAFFNPNAADFIKSLGLPLCRNMDEIAWPRFVIPPFDKFVDLWYWLRLSAEWAISYLIDQIYQLLMIKLCEIISKAICGALELAGDIAVAAVTTDNTVKDAIRESICGNEVDDETLDETVAELFASFGNGGAAFSDAEEVSNFTQAVSNSSTAKEVQEAFLGSASPEFLKIVDTLVEYDFPQFRASLKGPDAIASTFKNMGNVMPAEFKEQLKEALAEVPEAAMVPSLCLTPEQQEELCQTKAELLQGKVSPSQASKLCDSFTNQLLDDLGDIGDIVQGGLPAFLENNTPPLLSDPGCDNGILPYEPTLMAETVTATLGAQLETLKISYSQDMIGNGPGKKKWGLINMILSDTMGQPLTRHHRATSDQDKGPDLGRPQRPRQFACPHREAKRRLSTKSGRISSRNSRCIGIFIFDKQ